MDFSAETHIEGEYILKREITLYNVSLSKLLIKQDLNTHYNFVMKNLRQHRENVIR
jgi:hypothetical protein